jgi:hypothetical protein
MNALYSRTWLVPLLLTLLLMSWWTIRVTPASALAQAALTREKNVARDLSKIVALRGHEASVVTGPLPDNDLISRVQQSLIRAGIAASALSGIQPIAEQTDPISRLRQRRVQVGLHNISPAQMGAWTAEWIGPQQPWMIESLSLIHVPDSNDNKDRNIFDLTIALLNRSIEDLRP